MPPWAGWLVAKYTRGVPRGVAAVSGWVIPPRCPGLSHRSTRCVFGGGTAPAPRGGRECWQGTPLRSRLLFGMLYPAYASYKAVRTKNIREYVSKVAGGGGRALPGFQRDGLAPSPQVRWMMYWIVFALFSATETFTDLLISW